MRARDDLVARLNFKRCHGKVQSVRSISAGHTMADIHSVGKSSLKCVDVRSADESVVTDHAGDRSVDLAFYRLILKLQIRKRHGHPSASLFARREPARGIAGVSTRSCYIRGHDRAGADDDVVDDT